MTQQTTHSLNRPRGLPVCPACDGELALEALRHPEDYSPFLLRYCPKCLGIWGTDAAIGNGLSMYRMPHEALRVGGLPLKCRHCADGALGPGDMCANCGEKRQPLACPQCRQAMTAMQVDAVLLDTCEECDGLWLDRGEVNRLYGSVEMRPMTDHDKTEALEGDHNWEDDLRPSGIDVAMRFLEIVLGKTR